MRLFRQLFRGSLVGGGDGRFVTERDGRFVTDDLNSGHQPPLHDEAMSFSPTSASAKRRFAEAIANESGHRPIVQKGLVARL